MEWIKQLIEKHTKDGVLNQEELIKDVNKEFPNHAVPKETYNTLAQNKKALEEDIKDRDKQLESLKGIDAEGLQAEITRLQGENDTAKATYQKELKDLQLTNAIKLALTGKVHDEDLASGLVKRDELVLNEEGKVIGLDDQLSKLKENKRFLFVADKEDDNNQESGFQRIGISPNNQQGTVGDEVAAAFGNVTEK